MENIDDNLNKKIESAREFYNLKFLDREFENDEINKIRKGKLNKILEIIHVKKPSKIRKY